ncbi:PUB domain-containing protein [Haematococcus lacustris]|uniref:PUB domain-containing protein n=1 Tax=Haematococcus lacustris TaxID=44745 RepID=A0A699YIN0_HAELA|nr:PUB domain-containing protein [Haematococcus lacustris]
MVYAGYVPAKIPTVANELDRAVAAVTSLEALEVIGKLLYNAAISPKDDKFRRVRLSNAKIRATVAEAPGAVELLLAFGWVKDDDAEDTIVIPAGQIHLLQAAGSHIRSVVAPRCSPVSSHTNCLPVGPVISILCPWVCAVPCAGKYMSMKEVRMVEDQKEVVRKQQRAATTEAIRRGPAAVSPSAGRREPLSRHARDHSLWLSNGLLSYA